ncbi:MAG: VirB4 family type IV secretion/conjugal transfer ATPase [Legionellales bacterium]|nr:VirB4 family type IV secretion/conjugal transfer ATPase [Legionellales bacterium]
MRSLSLMGNEKTLADRIPYAYHVTDHVIATHAGDYLSVWKLNGRSHQCTDKTLQAKWIEDLNQLLRGLLHHNVCFWSHLHRRRVDEYGSGNFDLIFCQALNERYQNSFHDYPLMVNDLYLTVMIRPTTDKLLSVLSKHEDRSVQEKILLQKQRLNSLDEINNMLAHSLKDYGARCLSTYDKNDHVYSEALEFLGLLVNLNKQPVPICRDYINTYLNQERILFHPFGEVGEIRYPGSTRYFGMLDIKDYNDETTPGQFNELLHTPYEFILTQSFCPLSLFAARGFLKNHQKQLINANDVAVSQVDAISVALDQLESRQFIMGEHHASLLVMGESLQEVQQNLARSKALFADSGVIAVSSDIALEAAYFAQWPGNFRDRPRPMPITSLNFLCFSPFHNYLSGKPTGNPWGEAMTIFKTPSGSPLYFSCHVSGDDDDAFAKRLLGHTLVVGQSSAGKTTLVNFLLAQSQKFKPTTVCFDKDRGMEIAILAMGGHYLSLRHGIPTGLNPLQLNHTPKNKSFLKEWLLKLTALPGSLPHTHQEEAEIETALETLLTHIDFSSRRLSTLLQLLPNPLNENDKRPSVHARLLKWCEGHEYGFAFDNPSDTLDVTQFTTMGFDVTDFLDNPTLCGPMMMLLIYRMNVLIDGRRFIMVIDEFWKALSDPYFQTMIKDKLKTIRKSNGICIFATQEPEDAFSSPIASTIRQQIATLMLLENSSASREIYCDSLGLTLSEFEAYRRIPSGSRQFLIKQGGNAGLASFNLTQDPKSLAVLSGTPDQAEIARDCMKAVGEDAENWLPHYYQILGIA